MILLINILMLMLCSCSKIDLKIMSKGSDGEAMDTTEEVSYMEEDSSVDKIISDLELNISKESRDLLSELYKEEVEDDLLKLKLVLNNYCSQNNGIFFLALKGKLVEGSNFKIIIDDLMNIVIKEIVTLPIKLINVISDNINNKQFLDRIELENKCYKKIVQLDPWQKYNITEDEYFQLRCCNMELAESVAEYLKINKLFVK